MADALHSVGLECVSGLASRGQRGKGGLKVLERARWALERANGELEIGIADIVAVSEQFRVRATSCRVVDRAKKLGVSRRDTELALSHAKGLARAQDGKGRAGTQSIG